MQNFWEKDVQKFVHNHHNFGVETFAHNGGRHLQLAHMLEKGNILWKADDLANGAKCYVK